MKTFDSICVCIMYECVHVCRLLGFGFMSENRMYDNVYVLCICACVCDFMCSLV